MRNKTCLSLSLDLSLSSFRWGAPPILWAKGNTTRDRYTVLRLDDERAFVSLRCPEIRDELLQKEAEHTHRPEGCEWMPEYGAWMCCDPPYHHQIDPPRPF